MAVKHKRIGSKEPAWYEQKRHVFQDLCAHMLDHPEWDYVDADGYYRQLFPADFMQAKGRMNHDGKPNMIVLEDTGQDRTRVKNGVERTVRALRRYTVTDDLDLLEEIREGSLRDNTFVFAAPVSYYGKSRVNKNARYLHAFEIDLDHVELPQLKNLLHQMKSGVIPQATHIKLSGTGVHVVYQLADPFPLQRRYVPGLQVIKHALTDLIWNDYTSMSGPDDRQHQGIFQPFRMVGTATKLNGAIGKSKKNPYVCIAYQARNAEPVTVGYLASFIPKQARRGHTDDLQLVLELSQEQRTTTPIDEARELWPEWYQDRIVEGKPAGGYIIPRQAYDKALSVITEQGRVHFRYHCIRLLAAMANKCGVSRDELERDAYGLLERYERMTDDPSNHFTRSDIAAALDFYGDGAATAPARHAKFEKLTGDAQVRWEKTGCRRRPEGERMSQEDHLCVARAARDARQALKGTNWWDNGNRDGAPQKKWIVWEGALAHPEMNHTQLAKELGVSRPTVVKWLYTGWEDDYERALSSRTQDDFRLSDAEIELLHEEERRWQEEQAELYLAPHGGLEQEIVEYAATQPWKSHKQIAAELGYVGPEDVKQIIDDNKELYNSLLLGFEESLYGAISSGRD